MLDLAFDRSIGLIDFLDRSTQRLLFRSQNALAGALNTLPEALDLFGNLTGFLDCRLLHPPLDHHWDPIKALLGRQTTCIPIGLVQLLGQERFTPFGLFDRILDAIQQIEVLLFLFLPILEVTFWQVSVLIQFRIATKQRLASWAAGLWLTACWLTAIRPVGGGLWVPRRQIRLLPQLAFQFGLIVSDLLSLLDQLLDVSLKRLGALLSELFACLIDGLLCACSGIQCGRGLGLSQLALGLLHLLSSVLDLST